MVYFAQSMLISDIYMCVCVFKVSMKHLMCAVVMKHHYKPIGSLGVHVNSDLQWLYLCSIWGPMSRSHQMYIHMQYCVYV